MFASRSTFAILSLEVIEQVLPSCGRPARRLFVAKSVKVGMVGWRNHPVESRGFSPKYTRHIRGDEHPYPISRPGAPEEYHEDVPHYGPPALYDKSTD